MDLLVSIAIVAILGAMLYPVFSTSLAKSRQTACVMNERQIYLAIEQYVADNDDFYPIGISPTNNNLYYPTYRSCWFGQIMPYMKTTSAFTCPNGIGIPFQGLSFPLDYLVNTEIVRVYGNSTTAEPTPLAASKIDIPSAYALVMEADRTTNNFGAGYSDFVFSMQHYKMSVMRPYVRHGGGMNIACADGHVAWVHFPDPNNGNPTGYDQLGDCTQGTSYFWGKCGVGKVFLRRYSGNYSKNSF